jgi:hypothetical protein
LQSPRERSTAVQQEQCPESKLSIFLTKNPAKQFVCSNYASHTEKLSSSDLDAKQEMSTVPNLADTVKEEQLRQQKLKQQQISHTPCP